MAQQEIITTTLMAWKQCTAFTYPKTEQNWSFHCMWSDLFRISLQNICLFTTQTILKAAVQHGAVLDPRHQLPPSGKEYRNWLEKNWNWKGRLTATEIPAFYTAPTFCAPAEAPLLTPVPD